MAHPDLTSHHVNYLIWRYLQESGHGEAAIQLQRAWNHDPQSLPFAPYIKTHALVSLVQKGLQYYELEHSIDREGNATSFTPSSYFFGPAPLEQETSKVQHGPGEVAVGTDQAPVSPASKVVAREGGDSVTNGHLTAEAAAAAQPTPTNVKKTRKSDRSEANGDEGPMEVDSNGVTHPEVKAAAAVENLPFTAEVTVDGDGDVSMVGIRPELQDQEPPAPPPPPPPPTFTLTTGHSVGVQITPAKAADLGPDTALLEVAGADHVTRTLWRPNDPTVVVAAGDSFCTLWRLSSTAPPVQEKLIENNGDRTCVSAVSWEPNGHKLAVATYNDMRGSITMYDVFGNAVDLLPEVPRMITGLHWADSGSKLIVVASDSRISELALWDDSLRPDEFPSPQVIDGTVLDLCWLGSSQVYACGPGTVYQCDVDSSVHISKTFASSNPERVWSFIRCASVGSSPVAVAASSASAALWVPTHDLHLENAHEGEITAIEIKPNREQSSDAQNLFVASSSTDDTVKVWQINLESKHFDCIHQLSLGPSSPALAASFSPDSYALAAASKDNLFIWNAQRGGTPMAAWKAPASEERKRNHEPSGLVNGHNGTTEPAPDRSLAWDTDGKRLAFGFGNQLAIVNLQR
ncbi:WD40 repeat domain-containing protein [Aspergillus saccharolyticus JOP 1030-1]|uniref:WD40 repeat-like protein n=1 Tax=Aspergillus saccharolyticus JOP 1030-1 TaxID=1450539 RepID=A0A318ZKD2_9EURO|nr:WD40 repeat-like protein [Aspergillus saccharolyticus JOP 1030-1]PYH46844.1 WD40 repeat-like protein [Aspergillus saccharolyticus JOP 1030-1]